MDTETKITITSFAAHMAPTDEQMTATEKAKAYGWLCEEGRPTEAGKELAASLKGQNGTRSVFRQVA